MKQYLKEGASCPLMGAWFRFDTFGHELVLSLDTEYQNDGPQNDIVSYQALAISAEGRAIELIWVCEPGVRMSLAEICEIVRKLLGIKPRRLEMPKGKIPSPILLLWHFGAAEWAALRDREKLGDVLQIIRKVPVSLGTVPMEFKLNNRMVKCGIKVADTTLLAPAGKGSLAALGEVVGVPKIVLPDGVIARMRGYLGEDETNFAAYGINDCRITYAYYSRMQELANDVLGLPNMPLTLGGFGVSGYKIHAGNKALLEFLGLIKVKGYRKTSIEKSPEREIVDGFFAPAFCGGLNVAIEGEFKDTLVLDLDFRSCYPSAAATLPILDWDVSEHSKEIGPLLDASSDMQSVHSASSIALAYVTFRFPQECRWPTIPIRAGARGLIYPSFGKSFATTFELTEAYRKGAELDIHRLFHLQPICDEGGSPRLMFASYLSQLISKRGEHPKGSLENLMFKEMANSFYGKLAQGVRQRNVRSFDDVSALPESPITSPAHAGAVTGIVRAALIGLIDAIEECGGRVLAATTDGAMASFPHLSDLPRPVKLSDVPGLMDRALEKPGIRALQAGLTNMGISEAPIEIKHCGDRAIVWKTRGYIIYDGDDVQHVARAGHRATASELIGFDEDDDGTATWNLKRLSSVQSVWDGKYEDLVSVFENRRVNLDFDYKRIPTPSGEFRPPADMAEFEEWRDKMENIRKRGERATIPKVRAAVAGIKLQGGEVASMRRHLLRAVVRNLGNLYPVDEDGNPLTQRALARLMDVTVSDIKNAKRRPFTKLPRTELSESILFELVETLHSDDGKLDWKVIEREVFGPC
ncbi:MAG: hypothetical protein ABJF86_12195 [Tateyamaria sp.]|uniref:hypothetical protein n=1 Tax=Tateyamaria sp. TaxID=1929288 RepID=UPI003273EDBA